MDIKFKLRKDPKTVSNDEAEKAFAAEYITNEYVDKGDTILDKATGLIWQKGASDEYLSFNYALKYIEHLNHTKFAGYSDWRLPTIPELHSLLESEVLFNNDLYIKPVFSDSGKLWYCWSADTHSPDVAWGVGFRSHCLYQWPLKFTASALGVRSETNL